MKPKKKKKKDIKNIPYEIEKLSPKKGDLILIRIGDVASGAYPTEEAVEAVRELVKEAIDKTESDAVLVVPSWVNLEQHTFKSGDCVFVHVGDAEHDMFPSNEQLAMYDDLFSKTQFFPLGVKYLVVPPGLSIKRIENYEDEHFG